MYRSIAILTAMVFMLAACGQEPPERPPMPEPPTPELPTPDMPEPAQDTGETTAAAAIDEALAGDHRSEANRDRDAWRNPKETLLFFGLETDMTVVEVYPGAGWYTEVLAPVLRERGHLVAAAFDPERSDFARRLYDGYIETLEAHPEVFDRVEVITVGGDGISFGEDASADMVLTFRNMHSFTRAGAHEEFIAAAYRVLKPGGVLGVVAHRAAEDADPMEAVEGGYLPESFVVGLAEDAGFRFAGRSDINANPADTRDHPQGVWSLPPGLRVDDEDRDEYEAIGESDRMTLKFIKD